MLSLKKETWISARRRLLAQAKNEVAARLGPPSIGLEAYARQYECEFNGRWEPSNYQEIHEALQKHGLVLGGDFHAFAQSQRVHLRILRHLPQTKKVTLALECLESKHQDVVDSFMSGRMTESEFLERTQWVDRWGFPWESYKPLFDLARARKIKVLALNKYFAERNIETLGKRDQHAAEVLVKCVNLSPGRLVYAIFGDLHLAKDHLPEQIRVRSKGELVPLVLFLNSEKLYFQLAREELEHKIEVLKAKGSRYCVNASPPWVKWQSYQVYLEQNYDVDIDDEDDFHDFTDYICQLVHFVAEELDIEIKSDDLSVYSTWDDMFWEVLNRQLEKSQMKMAEVHIKNDRSFYLPSTGLAYLSRPTLNHGASVAGYYLQAKLSQRDRNLWNMPQDFIPLIWLEALAFFASKIVNHKRKSETLRDIRAQLQVHEPQDRGRESMLLALDQRMSEIITIHTERQRSPKFKPRRKSSYFEGAKLLGPMLGEKMFRAYRSQALSTESIRSYFGKNVEDSDFNSFYFNVVKRLESFNRRGLSGEASQ